MENLPDDLRLLLSNLKISIELNLSAVYLKLNKYRDALKTCNIVSENE